MTATTTLPAPAAAGPVPARLSLSAWLTGQGWDEPATPIAPPAPAAPAPPARKSMLAALGDGLKSWATGEGWDDAPAAPAPRPQAEPPAAVKPVAPRSVEAGEELRRQRADLTRLDEDLRASAARIRAKEERLAAARAEVIAAGSARPLPAPISAPVRPSLAVVVPKLAAPSPIATPPPPAILEASPTPASGSRIVKAGEPAPAVPSPAAASPVPTITAAPAAVKPASPLFTAKLTAEKLASVFASGPRAKVAAVAALRSLGFGKSVAYAALKPDGRFGSRLDFQTDGRIAWKA